MSTLNNVRWKTGSLSEIAEVVMGQSPPGSSYNTTQKGVGLINGPTEFTNKYPIVKQWTTKPTKICKPGDILLCVRGSSTGRMNVSNGNYCIGRGVASISAKEKKGVTGFIFYLLDYKISQLLKMSAGSTFPNLSSNEIKDMTIFIPPLEVQQKIASILSTWDKAIELKEKLIEQKKQQKKGLMQKLLTREVRLPGFEGKWRSLRILNFCNTYSGGTPSRTRKEFYENGTIPWIKSGELNSRKVTQTEEYITEKALAISTAKLVNPETILLALYGATAGVVAMSKIRASINQAILAIVPNDNCDNNFLFYYLENHMDKVTKKYTQGGQPNLNADIVKKMVVKLPSIEEQKAIANILSNIDNNIELLEKELNGLKQQKKGLMQLLLTGKVRVKV